MILFLPRSVGRVGTVPGRLPAGHSDIAGQLPGVRGVTRRREPAANEGAVLHRGAAAAPARLEALHLHARHGAGGAQHLSPGLGDHLHDGDVAQPARDFRKDIHLHPFSVQPRRHPQARANHSREVGPRLEIPT
ncbi:hypothetical protein CEXT_56321 [Caerostris extrusa]|uniref:Uncharacterized protein n=1 Tax=Caerostris extrusa TaxID=172846 RepID=A0AAV4T4B7_CAEEX|nr:hypothetical protein CEXT_56321 [Caerostris extrusa]